MGDVNRWYNPAETAEDFGGFGIIFPQHCMHHMDVNHVSNHNNIDTDTHKAVRNVEGIDSNGIKNNRNLCVTQAVLDVINISGKWD